MKKTNQKIESLEAQIFDDLNSGLDVSEEEEKLEELRLEEVRWDEEG